MRRLLCIAAVLAAAPLPARALTYQIDPAYSGVLVSVTHFWFFHPVANFEKVQGSFDYVEGKPQDWKASVTVSAASVNTGRKRWDRKLKSARGLDAKGHPDITFVSRRVTAGKKGHAVMEGDLTVKGITRSVRLDVTSAEPMELTLEGRVGLVGHGFVERSWWRIPAGLFFGRRAEINVLLQGAPSLQ